jgi:hypothetical protein
MSPIAISLVACACIFGGALIGMRLRLVLPENHLSAESKSAVNLGAGIIGTMAAFALGLLVASAKGYYDTQGNEVTEASAKIVLLDRVLAHDGPEAKNSRDILHEAVTRLLDEIWAEAPRRSRSRPGQGELLFDKVQELSPKDETQRSLKADALNLGLALGQTHWLMFAQRSSSISKPLLTMVVFWLTINFVSFGLFAPRNGTVIATSFLCALALSGAIFLILEMYTPFTGLIHISDAPLRNALAQLGH